MHGWEKKKDLLKINGKMRNESRKTVIHSPCLAPNLAAVHLTLHAT